MKLKLYEESQVLITPETKIEKLYVKSIIEQLTWVYKDTEIFTRVTGVPIKGKREGRE